MDNTHVLIEGGQAPCCSFTGLLLVVAAPAVILTSLCHHSHRERPFSIWLQIPQPGFDPMGREITAVGHCTSLFAFCQANSEPRAKHGHFKENYMALQGFHTFGRAHKNTWQNQISPVFPREYSTHHNHTHFFLHLFGPAAKSDTHSHARQAMLLLPSLELLVTLDQH